MEKTKRDFLVRLGTHERCFWCRGDGILDDHTCPVCMGRCVFKNKTLDNNVKEA